MTRDEAIKRLKEARTTIQPYQYVDEAIDYAIKALEQKTNWTPVSERPPENSDRYLAYIVNEHNDKLQYIMTCEYSSNGYWRNWFPDDECASDNVVAWMPLPEPYKAEKEENKHEI